MKIEKSTALCKLNNFPLKAQLTGSRHCEALGVVATSNAPVLKLCRELLAQSVNPDQALVVYRKGIEALRVRPIRDSAGLTIKEPDRGQAYFVNGPPPSHPPSPMRKNEPLLVGDWPGLPGTTLDAASTDEWIDWPTTETAS